MKARTILLVCMILLLGVVIGLPPSGHKPLYADPETSLTCVFFPYVVYMQGTVDTGISITGNSSQVCGPLHIYLWNMSGVFQGEFQISMSTATSAQWAATVSSLMPNGFQGSMLITTYIPDVRAAAFIMHDNCVASTPAIIDNDISGVSGGRIARESEPTAPYKTTLVFPYVTDEFGYDTGFAITNSSSNECGSATLYFYNKQGVCIGAYNTGMIPVNGSYIGLLSQILPGGAFGGYVIAIANFEHAQGCEFFILPSGHTATGMAAAIDGNITYGKNGIERGESTDNHTAIVLPYVSTNATLQQLTYVTLTNTVTAAGAVNAHFYLYGTDGNIMTANGHDCSWNIALGSNAGLRPMVTLCFQSSGVQLNGETLADYHDIGNFSGWMLIIVDAAGSYATATTGESTPNTLMSYNGVSDPDIIHVYKNEYPNDDYTIERTNPPSMDEPEYAYVPFFASIPGWTTGVNTICTRSSWDGYWWAIHRYPDAPYVLHGWDCDGWPLDDISQWVSIYPGQTPLMPASGPALVGEGEDTCGNFCVICPQNSHPYAVLFNTNDKEGIPGIPGNPPGEYIAPSPPTIDNPPAYVRVETMIILTGTPGATWSISDTSGNPTNLAALENLGDSGNKSRVRLTTGSNPSTTLRDVMITITKSYAEPQHYTFTIYKMALKQVTFSGDNYHTVSRDDGTGAYGTPQWQDNSTPLNGTADDEGDHKYPICYTRNNKLEATVKIIAEPAAAFAQAKISGLTATGISFSWTNAAVDGNAFTVTDIESTTALPDTVKYYESFDISWNLSPDGGTTCCYAGTSKNPLCVSYDTPLTFVVPDPPAPPVIDNRLIASHIVWACSKADSKNSKETVASAIQDAVKAETNFGGKGNWAWDLLNPGTSGDCFQQASLMQCAVTLLGIYADVRYVRASTDAGEGNCSDLETRVVNGRTQYLFMYFPAADPECRWNIGEGCCVLFAIVGGEEKPVKFYSITPKKTENNDYAILTAIQPQQFWVTFKRKVDQEWVPCGPEDDGAIIEEVFEEEAIP